MTAVLFGAAVGALVGGFTLTFDWWRKRAKLAILASVTRDPSFPVDDVPDVAGADAEPSSKSGRTSARCVEGADQGGIFGGKLGTPVQCSNVRSTTSAFADHVPHVVPMGSEEQVIRSDARAVVAAVENAHSLGDRPEGQLPGEPMSANVFGCLVGTEPHHAVPVLRAVSGPNQTVPIRGHTCPEPFAGWTARRHNASIPPPLAEWWERKHR